MRLRRLDRRGRALRGCERGRGAVLGFERGQSGSRIFLSLQMRLGAGDGGLCRGKIARRAFRSTGHLRRGDGLTGIAHFLYGGGAAADEADDSDQ